MKNIKIVFLIMFILIFISACGDDKVTITFETNGGSEINQISVEKGGFLVSTEVSKEGYIFDGWYLDETLLEPFEITDAINENITLYAKWEISYYTLTYESNGGLMDIEILLAFDDVMDLTAPTKDGYAFGGWYLDENLELPLTITRMPSESITIYAKWVIENYTISFVTNTDEVTDNLSVNAETDFILPTLIKTGYTFVGWYFDQAFEFSFDQIDKVYEDTTLYAKWEPNLYEITLELFDDNQNEVLNVSFDDELVIEDPTSSLYRFDGWYLDETYTTSFDPSLREANDFTIYAKWLVEYEYAYDMFMDSDFLEFSIDFETHAFNVKISPDLFYMKTFYKDDNTNQEVFIFRINDSQSDFYGKQSANDYWVYQSNDDIDQFLFLSELIIGESFNLYQLENEFKYTQNNDLFTSNTLETSNFNTLLNRFVDSFLGSQAPNVSLITHTLQINHQEVVLAYQVEEAENPITLSIKIIQQDDIIIPEFNLDSSSSYVQGISDTDIIIGNTVPTTGMFAAVGTPFIAGMNAYINHINDLGGIAGRQIELINLDDSFDASIGLNNTINLISQTKVFALVGHFGTPTITSTIDLIKESGIPTVYLTTSSNVIYSETQSDSIFPVQPMYYTDGRMVAFRAVNEEVYTGSQLPSNSKIGVIYDSSSGSVSTLLGVIDELRNYNHTAYTRSMNTDFSNLNQIITEFKNSGINSVIVITGNNTLSQIVNQMISSALSVPVFTTVYNAIPLNMSAEPTIPFDIYANNWLDINSVQGANDYQEFVSIMEEQGQNDYVTNSYAMAGYIAAYVFVEGLKRVGEDTLTWRSYIQALEADIIQIPMGGSLDYANGVRTGTNFSLSRYNQTTNTFDFYSDYLNYF